MNASRFNKKPRELLLYTATGLVILVIFALIIWIVPYVLNNTTPEASPKKAVTAFWVLIALHMVILAVLIWKILISRRGGRLRKIALIITGIILVLMSMFLIDAAGTNLEHRPDMFSVAIILFICSFCDMIAGIITIMLSTRLIFQKH